MCRRADGVFQRLCSAENSLPEIVFPNYPGGQFLDGTGRLLFSGINPNRLRKRLRCLNLRPESPGKPF
jgi:hypothetical protein